MFEKIKKRIHNKSDAFGAVAVKLSMRNLPDIYAQ